MPKTIAQYCILQWLKANFYMSHSKLEFISNNKAKITDENKDTAYVTYESGEVYLNDEE